MKPPYCTLCEKNLRSHPDEDFKLLYFKLTPAEAARKATMKKEGLMGHKPGAHWFCVAHRERALEFSHMTWEDAKVILMKEPESEGFWSNIIGRINSCLKN